MKRDYKYIYDVSPFQAINIVFYVLVLCIYKFTTWKESMTIVYILTYIIPLVQEAKIVNSLSYIINLVLSTRNYKCNIYAIRYIKDVDRQFIQDKRQINIHSIVVMFVRILCSPLLFFIINKIIGRTVIELIEHQDLIISKTILLIQILGITDIILVVLCLLETYITRNLVPVNSQKIIYDSVIQLQLETEEDCIAYQYDEIYHVDRLITYMTVLNTVLLGMFLITSFIITNKKIKINQLYDPINLAVSFKVMDELLGGTMANMIKRSIYIMCNDIRDLPPTSIYSTKRRSTFFGSLCITTLMNLHDKIKSKSKIISNIQGISGIIIRSIVLLIFDFAQLLTQEPAAVIVILLNINFNSGKSQFVNLTFVLNSVIINIILSLLLCVWINTVMELFINWRRQKEIIPQCDWDSVSDEFMMTNYYWSVSSNADGIGHIGISSFKNTWRTYKILSYAGNSSNRHNNEIRLDLL